MKHTSLFLIALFSPILAFGTIQESDTNRANYFLGNGAGITNLTGLVFTNSPEGFLTSGASKTVNAAGFVSVSVVSTNSQITWLTNTTSHVCFPMGNVTGLWTNYDSVTLLCNSNDTVLVTNMVGSGGCTLQNSWFQVLH